MECHIEVVSGDYEKEGGGGGRRGEGGRGGVGRGGIIILESGDLQVHMKGLGCTVVGEDIMARYLVKSNLPGTQCNH